MKFVLVILTVLLFEVQTLFAAPFLDGYYYAKDGQKVEGLIKFNRGSFSVFGSRPSSIKFKSNSGSKSVKLTPDDILSFVVESDSFTTIYNFKINSISGEYTQDFAQVIEVGKISLYLHRSSSSDGKMHYEHDNFIISADHRKFLGLWNFNRQREEIAKYFSNRPDLVEKILDKKDKTSIRLLVRDFNGT
jgi:hypothetical protein